MLASREPSVVILEALDSWVASTLNVLAIIASVLVTGLMVFLVLARYVLNLSIVGLPELILLSALQLYMIGAILASRNREHITVTWLAERITAPRKQAAHAALIAAITMTVTIFFMVWAYHMFAWGLKIPQHTPAYRIPLWILQLPIPVAAVACFLYALRDLVQSVFRVMAR